MRTSHAYLLKSEYLTVSNIECIRLDDDDYFMRDGDGEEINEDWYGEDESAELESDTTNFRGERLKETGDNIEFIIIGSGDKYYFEFPNGIMLTKEHAMGFILYLIDKAYNEGNAVCDVSDVFVRYVEEKRILYTQL